MGCTENGDDDDDDDDDDDNNNNTLKYYRYETLYIGTIHDKCMIRYNDRHKDHDPFYVSVE
jgi:hypothetical protein